MEGINKKIVILKKVVLLAFSKYKILYILSIISILSILIETLAMSLLSSISTRNYVIFDNKLKNLDPLLVFNIALLLFLARFVTMSYIESRYVYVARLFQHYLSETTFNKILNEKLREIEKQEIGYFISMSGDEASKCSEILNSFLRALNTITIGIFYFIMVLNYDIKFIYILLIFFIVNYFFMKKSMKKLYKLGNESLILSRNSGSVLLDAFNSLRTIKSFGVSNFIHKNYSEKMYEYQMTNFKITTRSIFNKIFPVIILFTLLGIYVFVDIYYVKKLNITYLLALFFMLMRLLTIIGDLFQTSSTVISSLKLTNDILNFSQKENIKRIGDKLNHVDKIEIKGISFGYTANNILFKNLNLLFTKGNSYAIIGKTGSGKSSLLDLIMNFNIPNEGVIEINEINALKYDENDFVNKILYVGQESMIFNDSILHNLQMDNIYDLNKINKMLQIAKIFDTVYAFDEGLNYKLNYRGTNISGGQKQRLNIARALLREPDVLILDESVNALDSETRKSLVIDILKEYEHKIIIFVTHDKDILNLVNHVYDLDKLKSI